jgi:hypothetical protein
MNNDFAYRVICRRASHYVHRTIGELDNHIVQAGRDNFVVRAGNAKNVRNLAVFNSAAFLWNTRYGDSPPLRLGKRRW